MESRFHAEAHDPEYLNRDTDSDGDNYSQKQRLEELTREGFDSRRVACRLCPTLT